MSSEKIRYQLELEKGTGEMRTKIVQKEPLKELDEFTMGTVV
jgi:hypothetical protein